MRASTGAPLCALSCGFEARQTSTGAVVDSSADSTSTVCGVGSSGCAYSILPVLRPVLEGGLAALMTAVTTDSEVKPSAEVNSTCRLALCATVQCTGDTCTMQACTHAACARHGTAWHGTARHATAHSDSVAHVVGAQRVRVADVKACAVHLAEPNGPQQP
jgi:hypothetical protein